MMTNTLLLPHKFERYIEISSIGLLKFKETDGTYVELGRKLRPATYHT